MRPDFLGSLLLCLFGSRGFVVTKESIEDFFGDGFNRETLGLLLAAGGGQKDRHGYSNGIQYYTTTYLFVCCQDGGALRATVKKNKNNTRNNEGVE
jgi:hypothetical protein